MGDAAVSILFFFTQNINNIKSSFSFLERMRNQRLQGRNTSFILNYIWKIDNNMIKGKYSYSYSDTLNLQSIGPNSLNITNIAKNDILYFFSSFSKLYSETLLKCQRILNYKNQSKEIGVQRSSSIFKIFDNNNKLINTVILSTFMKNFNDINLFKIFGDITLNGKNDTDINNKLTQAGFSFKGIGTNKIILLYKNNKIIECINQIN